MPTHRFRRSTLPAQPWKNGGGVTHEVLCLPAGSDLGHFDWRVSIARIARSGPFSAFADVDRIITLLDGAGVHLRSDDGAIDHRLDAPLQPFAFPGEAAVQAELLGEACHDLNVMTRRGACRARVLTLHGAITLPTRAQGLLLVMREGWQLQGDPGLQLGAGEGLWWHASDIAWRLSPQGPDSAMLAVLIDSAPP